MGWLDTGQEVAEVGVRVWARGGHLLDGLPPLVGRAGRVVGRVCSEVGRVGTPEGLMRMGSRV